MGKKIVTIIMFIGLIFQTYGQENETDTFKVDEVIIRSGPVVKPGVILPTFQVTRTMLDNSSPVELITPVNKVPGVFIQSGAINTNRITIRGVGSRTLYGTNKIRAFYNGFSITNGGGETSIDSYDPENLSSIDIIKGPKATEYGTNLGGTILLNSVRPEPGAVYIRNNSTFGSYGLFKNAAAAGYADEELSLHLNYDHLQTDGFRENSRYKRNGFQLTGNYEAGPRSELSLLISRISYLAYIPSSLGKTDFEEDPTRAAENWKAARGYEDNAQTLAGISLSSLFDESFINTTGFLYTNVDHYEARPFNILDEQTNGFSARSVFMKTFDFMKSGEMQLSFGGEWFSDVYKWKTIQNLYEQNNGNGSLEGELLSKNKEFRNYWNIFVSAILPFNEKLKAQAGLNFNKTEFDFRDQFNTGDDNTDGTRKFDPILAPTLSVIYSFTPQKTIYVNVSRGFNFPGLEETLGTDGRINSNIGPEKGWNYELGTDLLFAGEKLHLNMAAYIMAINDLLVPQRVGEDEYIGKNAGKTLHRGVEVLLDYSFTVASEFLISPFFNSSLNFHKFVDSNDLTGVPDVQLNAGVNISHPGGLFIYAGYQHVGSMPMNDENTLYSDAYDLIDLKAGYKARIVRDFFVEVNAGVNNVADSKYASSILINATTPDAGEPRYYYPGMPRNFYGSLKLRYNF